MGVGVLPAISPPGWGNKDLVSVWSVWFAVGGAGLGHGAQDRALCGQFSQWQERIGPIGGGQDRAHGRSISPWWEKIEPKEGQDQAPFGMISLCVTGSGPAVQERAHLEGRIGPYWER